MNKFVEKMRPKIERSKKNSKTMTTKLIEMGALMCVQQDPDFLRELQALVSRH